ncbi:uncharacterized protein [Physcomitrium patens]|uniref:Bifunctional inhibitor/plant lipid transfer protein/seed storage helical domain-containing protein n=1 Tax=Physcomitrium patens TaxID=3218 RepID=A9SZZ0_PHYPA|nr:hypothetical protein PHYPA_020247 [Physcomitrium patens]
MAAAAFVLRNFLLPTLLASVAPQVLYPTTASLTSASSDPPISCSLPSASMVSPNHCNADDDQIMRKQTQSCQSLLTMVEDAPTSECCTGLNNIAFNRIACVCKKTFYPPTAHNASRQLDLP